jgi:8-oxo-dGTP pyrophosphatase MutT (NUDIX family)
LPAEERRLIRQYGVLAFRQGSQGHVEILLITSRETQRWVVPRGNPISGLSAHEAAAQEAYEEAGVRGAVAPSAIGSYRYDKKRASGAIDEAEVELFPLEVREELDEWPERAERERRWFAAEEAASSVEEADLAALIRGLGGAPAG